MLHFAPDLSRDTLADLAAALVKSGKLKADESSTAIACCAARLRSHFGIHLPP
jgi:hypothetical protein